VKAEVAMEDTEPGWLICSVRASVIASHALSWICSMRLSWHLCRLPSRSRLRLLPRQLLGYAIADCIYHGCQLVSKVMVPIYPDMCKGDSNWMWLFVLQYFGNNASLLFEICIALLFLFQSLQCRKLLLLFRKSSVVVFTLSGILSVLERAMFSVRYEASTFRCSPWRGRSAPRDLFFICLTSMALFLCTVTLVLCVARRRRSPNLVHQRSVMRAIAYMLNVLITEVPTLVVVAMPSLAFTKFDDFAMVCRGLNGTLNAVTFFRQSRYASQSIHDVPPVRDVESFSVQFTQEVNVSIDARRCETQRP